MKAAIYARVSTLDQNCALQLRELKEYAKRRGWTVHGIYKDTGWSGAKASRPEMDRMMADAQQHRFDAVLCWKLDRFGRSVLNLVESLEKLRSWDIRFMATTQNIDTDESNPTAKLILWVLAAVAEFEREMIRERVKAGMSAAIARGVKMGRPRLVVDRSRAKAMSKRGMSVREIGKKLGCSKSAVARMLAA